MTQPDFNGQNRVNTVVSLLGRKKLLITDNSSLLILESKKVVKPDGLNQKKIYCFRTKGTKGTNQAWFICEICKITQSESHAFTSAA